MNSDEISCPFCAETIKSSALKCRFCNSDISKNGIGSNTTTQGMNIAACTNCNVALIPITKPDSLSLAGVIGTFMFIAGIISIIGYVAVPIFSELLGFGLLMMLIGLLISIFGRGKSTRMVCPKCGSLGATL